MQIEIMCVLYQISRAPEAQDTIQDMKHVSSQRALIFCETPETVN